MAKKSAKLISSAPSRLAPATGNLAAHVADEMVHVDLFTLRELGGFAYVNQPRGGAKDGRVTLGPREPCGVDTRGVNILGLVLREYQSQAELERLAFALLARCGKIDTWNLRPAKNREGAFYLSVSFATEESALQALALDKTSLRPGATSLHVTPRTLGQDGTWRTISEHLWERLLRKFPASSIPDMAEARRLASAYQPGEAWILPPPLATFPLRITAFADTDVQTLPIGENWDPVNPMASGTPSRPRFAHASTSARSSATSQAAPRPPLGHVGSKVDGRSFSAASRSLAAPPPSLSSFPSLSSASSLSLTPSLALPANPPSVPRAVPSSLVPLARSSAPAPLRPAAPQAQTTTSLGQPSSQRITAHGLLWTDGAWEHDTSQSGFEVHQADRQRFWEQSQIAQQVLPWGLLVGSNPDPATRIKLVAAKQSGRPGFEWVNHASAAQEGMRSVLSNTSISALRNSGLLDRLDGLELARHHDGEHAHVLVGVSGRAQRSRWAERLEYGKDMPAYFGVGFRLEDDPDPAAGRGSDLESATPRVPSQTASLEAYSMRGLTLTSSPDMPGLPDLEEGVRTMTPLLIDTSADPLVDISSAGLSGPPSLSFSSPAYLVPSLPPSPPFSRSGKLALSVPTESESDAEIAEARRRRKGKGRAVDSSPSPAAGGHSGLDDFISWYDME